MGTAMTVVDILFDDFFGKPIPAEGFEIDPTPSVFPGLIGTTADDRSELHGYEVTMDGDVVPPDLRPEYEVRNR